jgi:hypothetical protein
VWVVVCRGGGVSGWWCVGVVVCRGGGVSVVGSVYVLGSLSFWVAGSRSPLPVLPGELLTIFSFYVFSSVLF